MRTLLSFPLLGALFGASLTVLGLFLLVKLTSYPDLWKKLPREKRVGAVLGAICFAWSAWLAYPLFEGGLANLRTYLPYVAVAMTILCYVYLEYLFTRAFGGILLLTTTALMHQAFADRAPARWAVSILCYLIALAGMFMIGSPWRFRDLIKSMIEKESVRRSVGLGLTCAGVALLIIAGLTYGRTA